MVQLGKIQLVEQMALFVEDRVSAFLLLEQECRLLLLFPVALLSADSCGNLACLGRILRLRLRRLTPDDWCCGVSKPESRV